MAPTEGSAAERKAKRLALWRKRQQEAAAAESEKKKNTAPPRSSLKISLGGSKKNGSATRKRVRSSSDRKINVLAVDDGDVVRANKKTMRAIGFDLEDDNAVDGNRQRSSRFAKIGGKSSKASRWDVKGSKGGNSDVAGVSDALDEFMDKLSAGAMGSVTMQETTENTMTVDVSGSMMKVTKKAVEDNLPKSGGMITPDEIAKLTSVPSKNNIDKDQIFTSSDWESDRNAAESESEPESDTFGGTDDEEKGRRLLIEALKSSGGETEDTDSQNRPPQLLSEVKSEKQRREEKLKQLQSEADMVRRLASDTPDIGRLYNDEGGVMEEAERNLEVLTAAPDALEVLAELNKKKELKAVDHSQIDYIAINKNLYIVPRALANLSSEEMIDRRAKLKIKVRGVKCPAPISSFEDCGLSERLLSLLKKQNIKTPFPIQSQCLPAIMSGRDVIGIAKTGSGKTLAYLLPMLRHILDQPELQSHESGPIGLVLAPARELASQIHNVCKIAAKALALKSTAVYGGAGVADQIADLKRGVHIAVATPGRLIDILTMQSGKILSLQRVSYVVMDEADRMFDMGFAPQIAAILTAVRPDRQTVLFSATFPKSVENLARKSLKYPIEVIVGGRSVASDSITQYAELVEDEDKFFRLLQLLGENVSVGKKVIVFVDTQIKADSVFEQLARCGYSTLSLHGGKEQEDRDSTISDFKRQDGPEVLVATSVAGRGLDVPTCACVINFCAPNHLEDYVHRVGRTGRAGNKGLAYTFVNSAEEAKFAPIVVRAMVEAGQAENIDEKLKELSDTFKEKVKKGEARWAGSGFKGKGYSYDATELNDAQKLARLEKRQALIEAGLIDPDEDDPTVNELLPETESNSHDATLNGDASTPDDKKQPKEGLSAAVNMQARLSANVLALPGMQEAIMRKAGVIPKDGEEASAPGGVSGSHFVEEIEINDYPREARWKVTQKETTSRLQDEFQTAVTLKGEYFAPNRIPAEGERRLYLHLEATTERILKNCVLEIRRLLNEETLRVGTRGLAGHRYNVL